MSGKKTPTGTREWAASSVNCMDGCKNGCLYCYAKAQAIRFNRETAKSWEIERPREMPKRFGKRHGTVMFPTTHDITSGNFKYCRSVLWNLLDAGNKILVVSKPSPYIIKQLCGDIPWAKENILFRFTIGSMDQSTLDFWEPKAPTFAERLYSLMWAHDNGWQTSVSMEPMLDTNPDNIIRLVKTVVPYVTDAIWIGKANKLGQRCSINVGGHMDQHMSNMVLSLEESQSDAAIIRLYDRVMSDPVLAPKVKWKESIKKVVGIKTPDEIGLDI